MDKLRLDGYGGSKLWRQRLLSNSISKSSSVLSGTVIRDFNDGGDLLCSNTTFTSCSTSTVRPMTRRSIEMSLLQPYLRPNLRRHKSQDGRYEWQDAAFGTGTLFDFYDFSSEGERYFEKGTKVFFSTSDDTIHFTRCTFSNIDGTDPTDEDYRGDYGTAILVRCHSSLFVDQCHFTLCTSEIFSGVIHVEMDSGDPSVLVNSSTFEEYSSAESYQPSILYFYSFGCATLSSSVITGHTAVRNNYIVESDNLIASSCSFDYNSTVNKRAIQIEAFASFRFCSFHSDSQADRDTYTSYFEKNSMYFGCVSNSAEGMSHQTIGLSPPTLVPYSGEIIADSATIQSIMTNSDAPMIFVGAGDFGDFEVIERSIALKGWHPNAPVNPSSSITTKFSGIVQAGAGCDLHTLLLETRSPSSSILTSEGMSLFTQVHIDGLSGQLVHLFICSGVGSELFMDECRIMNIVDITSSLVVVKDEAHFFITDSQFFDVSSTNAVISAQLCNTVTINKTSFTGINRTAGVGPAAVEIDSAASVTMNNPFFCRSRSDKGNVGAINLTCLLNSGADNAPTDILFEDRSKSECETILKYSIFLGEGPHFGWKKEDDSGTGSFTTTRLTYINLRSAAGFVSQSFDNEIYLHPSDFHLSDIVRSLPQSQGLTVRAESMLDTPIVLKPMVVKSWIFFDDELLHDLLPRYRFEQDESEQGILITILDSGSFQFHSADVLVDSLNTETMVRVEKEAEIRIAHSIIRGDEGQPTRPFLQSQGQVNVFCTHFISMTLSGCSCIEMNGGNGVEALMVFDVSASVLVNDLKFVNCNQTEAVETTRIVVTGRNLERMDTSKWNGFDSLTLSDTLNWGIDTLEGSGNIWRVVPLRVVLTHFTNTTIKTEESGKDMVGCGEGEWSCRGLVRAGRNVGGDTGCTITVVGSSFLDGVFDPAAKRTTVESSSSQSVIVVSKEGAIVNSPDGGQAPILSLSHLSFSLQPSLDSDSLMKSLGGELKIDNCWFVCSSAIDFSLVSATGGIATITEVSLSIDLRFSKPAFAFSDLSSAKFHTLDSTAHFGAALISAKGTPTGRWKLTITQSSIKGSETDRNEEHDENANLCAWSSGAVELEDVNCEVSWTTLSHLGQGAMHARNSIVTFHQSSVTNNGISTGLFPSARQNIRCVGSSRISFETSAMGTGDVKNGWVSGDSECVVEGVVGEERKLFFEPTLDSKLSLSTLNKKEKKYEVSIVGSTLIPCGLSLEVFENEKSSTNRVLIPLSEIASEWNETSLSLVIPATRLSSLSNTPQWLGRISFGGVHSTDSFEMKLSAKMARANEMKKTLPWLIPLIVVLSLLLIVGIILFVLCRRRKQKMPTNMSEMEPQEPIEDEKMDVLNTQSHPPNSALSTLNSKPASAEGQNTNLQPVSMDLEMPMPHAQCIEALACHGKMEMARHLSSPIKIGKTGIN
ncbi:hypothetical protein BLNAU_6900 [Blattamonas nauphoetae]|uniref:Uncharacterized protein n=1 Tax=Blattamonas nauphoetae TaxID=2049346 RepID=A0ABQ9Y378_9EUKA|nr:hypothetical protein BLNAU_6900 [Blattamonas nauphoetae]